MKRRLFILSGSSAAVAATLSACGGGGGGGAAADPTLAAGGSTAGAAGAAGANATPENPSADPTSGVPQSPAPNDPAAPASGTGPFSVGLNVHGGGNSIAENTQIAALLQARNFKRIRMDYMAGQDQTLQRDFISKVNAYGGSVEMSMQISYQWDNNVYSDLGAVQANAYNQAYAAADAMKDLVHDFELLNETQLRPEIRAAVGWNSAGTNKAAFQNQPALSNLAAILRGMANAIHDVAARSGKPLRVIMGVVGRDFGFLNYLQDEGVHWDVTGYHIYPREGDTSLKSDAWYGPGGPLAQLGAFGKPVTINEFNSGEIYDGDYENTHGRAVTEKGLRSVAKHMLDLYSQTQCNLESVVLYELRDDPSKPAPENRFGVMHDLNTPKAGLYLATVLAGGALSAAERSEITSRGLLTDGQIDAMRL